MTDIVLLARKLYERIEWQNVPDTVTQEDMTILISDSIRHLYVMTGRALAFSEDDFVKDGELFVSFKHDLPLDEREYVQVFAEIMFYKKVQTTVNELTSYTTDAMAVSHGDKPFANLQQTIDATERRLLEIWYKMNRYHLL